MKNKIAKILLFSFSIIALVFGGVFGIANIAKPTEKTVESSATVSAETKKPTATLAHIEKALEETTGGYYIVSDQVYYASDNISSAASTKDNTIAIHDGLKIVFLKEQASVNSLASTNTLATSVASVFAVTKTKDGYTITTSDEINNATITASKDAEYTLGELVTCNNNTVSYANGEFTINNLSSGNTKVASLAATSSTSAKVAHITAGTITFSSATYGSSSGTVTAARAFYVNSGATLTLSGVNIYYFRLSDHGAGVYNVGTLNFENSSKIQGCQAQNSGHVGGAIYSSGTCNIKSGDLYSNYAYDRGGAIYQSGGTLTMSGGSIRSNSVGGGNNDGGGVYAGSSTVTLSGTSIYSNTAGDDGGGLFLESCTTTMSSGSIYSNTGNYGGGVHVLNGTFNLSGGSLYSNQGNVRCGAIYVRGNGRLNMSGGTIGQATNTTTPATSGSNSNYSASYGGGIYCGDTGVLNLTGGSIYRCYAASHGGGIMIDSGSCSINGVTIRACGSGTVGGGIYTNNGITLTGNTNIEYNKSARGGGVYFNGGTSTINHSSVDIVYNNATAYGAGVYNNGTLNFSNGYICWNTATSGDGGAANNGTINMSGGYIYGNKAPNGAGVTTSGAFNLSGGYIGSSSTGYENIASSSGGGIYYASGTFSMTGGQILYNKASSNGAGIYAPNNGLTINGGSIHHNSGATNGGGVYYAGGSFVMTSGNIYSNSATNGGGVYCGYYFYMRGGSIYSNSATYGGGVYSHGLSITIGDASSSSTPTIRNNTASTHGGGIYANGSGCYVNIGQYKQVDIYSNTATNGHGGGIYMTNKSYGNFYNANMYSNSSYNTGRDIYSKAWNTTTISGGTYKSGIMSSYYKETKTSNNVTTTTTGNQLVISGGTVYQALGHVRITGGTIGNVRDEVGDSGFPTITITGGTFIYPQSGYLVELRHNPEQVYRDRYGTHSVSNATFGYSSGSQITARGIHVGSECTTTINISNCRFYYLNYSENGGTAIKLNQDTNSIITGCTFDHCTNTKGSAVKILSGTHYIRGCTFSYCTTQGQVDGGGAIYLQGGTLTVEARNGSTSGSYTDISNCSTSGSGTKGGGIYVRGGRLNLIGVYIHGCSSPGGGGGVYNNGSLYLYSGCSIYSNSTSGYGGGIYNNSYLYNSGSVYSNTASTSTYNNIYNYSSGGGSSGGCVTEDTRIMVSFTGATKRAIDLAVGDNIVVYNEQTNEYILATIDKIYVKSNVSSTMRYVFNDGTYIDITDNHALLTTNGYKNYIQEDGLNIGDVVITRDGYKTLTDIQVVPYGGEYVYNFLTSVGSGFIANKIVIEKENNTTPAVPDLRNNVAGIMAKIIPTPLNSYTPTNGAVASLMSEENPENVQQNWYDDKFRLVNNKQDLEVDFDGIHFDED